MSDRIDVLAYMRDNPLALLPERGAAMVASLATGTVTQTLETRVIGGIQVATAYDAIEAARLKRQKVSGAVGVLPLYGFMDQKDSTALRWFGGTSTEQFGADFDAMLANPEVGAVVIDVDSPGGSVFGLQELADRMNTRDRSKPVVAIANSMMASAAYFIGAQADSIFVTPGGQAGSIGTWTAHIDESKALEAEGLDVTFISAGKYKLEGNSTEPLSDEARDAMQAVVDSYYDSFVKAVATGRKTTPAKVRSGYGEGRMLVAAEAVAAGLADGIATLPEVIDSFRAKQSKARQAAQDRQDTIKALGRRAHQIREAQISQLTRRSE